MNFFHEGFLIFEQKVSDFQRKMFGQPINLTFHASRFIFRDESVFWSDKSIFQFFSKVDRKRCRFWEKSFQRSSFPEEISPEKRFLEKCSWVFFGPWANRISDFCKSFQHGAWGVRKAIYVSRVPFGGKLIFGSNKSLLREKWQIVSKVSDVCWELLSMVVKLHFSCREEKFELMFLEKIVLP